MTSLELKRPTFNSWHSASQKNETKNDARTAYVWRRRQVKARGPSIPWHTGDDTPVGVFIRQERSDICPSAYFLHCRSLWCVLYHTYRIWQPCKNDFFFHFFHFENGWYSSILLIFFNFSIFNSSGKWKTFWFFFEKMKRNRGRFSEIFLGKNEKCILFWFF